MPDMQGRRIDAHYILGKSYKQIADEEGVDENAVRASVKRGLQAIKRYLLTASGLYPRKTSHLNRWGYYILEC